MSEQVKNKIDNISNYTMFSLNSDDKNLAKIPQYLERANPKGWIDFGIHNDMPDYYGSLLSKCGLHRSICEGKARLIAGQGFEKNGLDPKTLEFLKNRFGEKDFEEMSTMWATDLVVFGAFALNIHWSKDRTQIAKVDWISPSNLRIAVPDQKKPEIEKYYFCLDWKNYKKNDVILYDGFSTTNRKSRSQILYVTGYTPCKYFYGEPSYISNCLSIENNYEIQAFHYNNIRNSFSPSFLINFVQDIPSDEAQDMLVRRTKANYAGSRKSGEVMVTFSRMGEQPIVTPLGLNQNDQKYIELETVIEKNILAAHQVTSPEIFGIKSEGGIINNQTSVLNALEVFQAMYVNPQQQVIEKTLNKLFRINRLEPVKLAKYKINFAKTDLSVDDILKIISAPVSNEVKVNMLVSNGYTEEEAKKFVPEQKEVNTQI